MTYELPKVGVVTFINNEGLVFDGEVRGRQEVEINFLEGRIIQKLITTGPGVGEYCYEIVDLPKEKNDFLQFSLLGDHCFEWDQDPKSDGGEGWSVTFIPDEKHDCSGSGGAPDRALAFEEKLRELVTTTYPLALFSQASPTDQEQRVVEEFFEDDDNEDERNIVEFGSDFSYERSYSDQVAELTQIELGSVIASTIYTIEAFDVASRNLSVFTQEEYRFMFMLFYDIANWLENEGDGGMKPTRWNEYDLADYGEAYLLEFIESHYSTVSVKRGLKLAAVMFNGLWLDKIITQEQLVSFLDGLVVGFQKGLIGSFQVVIPQKVPWQEDRLPILKTDGETADTDY